MTNYQLGFNTNSWANPLMNWGILIEPQEYRPVYQQPVILPYPNFPVSEIRSIKDLPVWNYQPEPARIALYQNSFDNFNSLYNINFSKNNSNNYTVAPQPTIPLEQWVKSLNLTIKQDKQPLVSIEESRLNAAATNKNDKSLGKIQQQISKNLENWKEKNLSISLNNKAKTTKTLSAEFLNRVKEIAQKLKCDYRDLLGVMNSESGLNPKARNKHSGAIGLIQFTDIAIKDLNQTYGMNLTKNKIANMSALEQLDLVEKYLTRTKSFRFNSSEQLNSADLYAIVYRPAFAGKKVIATEADGKTYRLNRGLDLDKDGVISDRDLAQVVRNKHINVNLVA